MSNTYVFNDAVKTLFFNIEIQTLNVNELIVKFNESSSSYKRAEKETKFDFFSGKPSLKIRYSNTYQFESIKSNHNLFFDKAVVDIDVSEDALSKNIISFTSNFLFKSKTAIDLFYNEVHELFNSRTIKVADSYEINDDIKESVFTNKKFNANTINNIYLVYNQKSKDGFFEIFVQIGK